jgi:3'(2'), 5'-bisphosphate nucleotidase
VVDLHSEGDTLPKPASVEEMLDLIDLGRRGTGCESGRFWVMDPVDGTAAFLKGQQYAVSLALIEDGNEVVGIIGCPNISAEMTRVSEGNVDKEGLGIMLTAVRGQGSTVRTMTPKGLENAIPLDILKPFNSNRLHIVDCVATITCRHDVIAKLADRFEAVFPNTEIWSSHIRYAALILGGGDVQFLVPASLASKMYIWDHAGAQLIFTELGGKVTDLDGNDIDFCAGRDLNRNRGLVVARGEIHEIILAAMDRILVEEEK